MHKYITIPITVVVNAHGHELSITLERFYVTTRRLYRSSFYILC